MEKPYSAVVELFFRGVIETDINYVAGDADVYPLSIGLTKNKKPFPVPEDATAYLALSNAKGESFARRMEITDHRRGKLRYLFSAEDIGMGNTILAAVTLVSGAERLTWPCFRFRVSNTLVSSKPPDSCIPWTVRIEDALSELISRVALLEESQRCGRGDIGSMTDIEYANDGFPELTNAEQGLDLALGALKEIGWKS